jgi:hypothetical protein
MAVGDLDGDGRPDLVVNRLDGPAAFLRNESAGGRWLAVELRGRRMRQPVGARLRATIAGREQVREVVGGGSYLSASDPRLFLGLGEARGVDRLEVRWPSGRVEAWRHLGAGHVRLEEGTGETP